MFSCDFFFFNDPATTEIYPYCHTLSLHGALPICARVLPSPAERGLRPCRGGTLLWRAPGSCALAGPIQLLQCVCRALVRRGLHVVAGLHDRLRPSALSPPVARMPSRSEEHTSELTSLMRISYAVFCLKKKT